MCFYRLSYMSNPMAYSDLRCNVKKLLRYCKNSCLVNNSAIIFIINIFFYFQASFTLYYVLRSNVL